MSVQPPTPQDDATIPGDVMASIDSTGSSSRLIIADISTDDDRTWISIPATAAASLADWR